MKADKAFIPPQQSRDIFASKPAGESVHDPPWDRGYSISSGYYLLLGGRWISPPDNPNGKSGIPALQDVKLNGEAKE